MASPDLLDRRAWLTCTRSSIGRRGRFETYLNVYDAMEALQEVLRDEPDWTRVSDELRIRGG